MNTRWMAAGVLLVACGAAPPEVEPAPPVGAQCQALEAPAASPSAAAPESAPTPGSAPASGPAPASGGLGLRRLLPGAAPVGAAPLTLEQLLVLERAPDEERWRALPAEADTTLLKVAADGHADPTRRVRAMSGLAARRAADAPSPLRALLADRAADPGLRRGAARALAAGWIDAEGGANVAALATALEDPDPQLREAVAHALAPHAALPAVRDALAARRDREEAAHVREALTRALEAP